MKRIIYFIFLIFVLIFLFSKNIYAVTTSISNLPQSISTDPFAITITISGASSGTNYLRIDLYKPSTSNYFAETFSGSSWYDESDHTQYYPAAIQSGANWVGQIQGRFGNPTSNQYDEPGPYKLRVRRYTSSGSYNTTEANNSATDVTINVLFSTPTSNPVPTQAPSPTENQSLTPTETVVQQTSPTSNLQTQTYNNIYISEVMIDPETGANEWVEIYNGNDYQVNLTDWNIDDIENSGTAPKKFSLTINPKGYAVLDLSSSIFNNDGDNVRLLEFNQVEIDSFQYQSSEKGKSLGRTSFDNDSFCLQTPTKKNPNSQCISPTPTPTPKSTTSSTSTITPTYSPLKTITIIKTPTKARPTVTPVKFSLFTQNQQSITDSPEEIDNEVLGMRTHSKARIDTQTHALLSSLSFASSSFSILSIISILLKVKMNS